jgi:ketosteroid isomerase-like protein
MEDVAVIAAVQNAYAVAIDSRNWAALRDCFMDDASIGFGRPARIGGLEEFLEWAPAFHADLGETLHQITTHQARLGDGDAIASCYLHALLLDAGGGASTSVFGRYDDVFTRVDGGWRIRRRRFCPVWRHRNTEPAELPTAGGTR